MIHKSKLEFKQFLNLFVFGNTINDTGLKTKIELSSINLDKDNR